MSGLEDEIEKLTDPLMCNYLLNSVMIICVEKVEDGSQLCVARKGNCYEHIGMLEDMKYSILTDKM